MSESNRDDLWHLRKKRVTLGLLLFIAAWPLVHRVLVMRFEVNPWKLGGFAMYASVVPPLRVTVFHDTAQGVVPLDERRLPAPVRQRLRRFRIERHALGQFRSADDTGRSILSALPELEWVVISVQRLTLDPETARMRASRKRYRYQQPLL
jgi:hypothetical protein